MGNKSTAPIKNFQTIIKTKDGKELIMSYHSLVEHIILLRNLIKRPELRQPGLLLDSIINDYCQRMAYQQLKTSDQQEKLPLEIEWIWHVHRLHPIHYFNDCIKQFNHHIVDKKILTLNRNYTDTNNNSISTGNISSINRNLVFVPSIDLKSAVIQQNDFLDKFQQHFFYKNNLEQFDENQFQNLIENYVAFFRLARKNQMIVPTFDIDIIWHTHLRYPLEYQQFSKSICGFILDHDDSIESSQLKDAFNQTAQRWEQIYQTEYGENIDRKHLETTQYTSSCAMVYRPVVKSENEKRSSQSTSSSGCGSSWHFQSRFWNNNGAGTGGDTGADSSADGSGCGSGCGGD